MSSRSDQLIDSFTLPGYDVPDAHPVEITNDSQRAQPAYTIPLVVWMFVFLLVGYLGVRWILED